jgi:hypothetical protein
VHPGPETPPPPRHVQVRPVGKPSVDGIRPAKRLRVVCGFGGRTGVHFAGTMIGCLRRLQNWSLTSTIDKVPVLRGCSVACVRHGV